MRTRTRALLFTLVFALASNQLSFIPLRAVAHAQEPQQPAAQQTLVEAVDITGNRRNSDENLQYYIQTRQGDPFNEQQVQRDLQALLTLGFFDKTATRVFTEPGERGGVLVIFEVKELPIIRDIQFKGLKSITEADVLKAFRESRTGVSKESIADPVKIRAATRVIRELLAARGYPNAKIDLGQEEVSATSIAITFNADQGERVRVVEVDFDGNQVFKDGELRGQMKYVREAGLVSRFKGQDILDQRKLGEDLRLVTNYMRSKGHLQARTGEPRIDGIGQRRTGLFIPLPLLSSTDDALRITVPVIEGKVYRLGEIKIEGNSIFSEDYIRAVIGLKPGEVANGDRIGKALYEDLKKVYGSQGFIQYEPAIEPAFRDNAQNPNEGIADFTVSITEGKQFTLRRLEFLGNTFTRDNVLRREIFLNEGDIYNQIGLENSVIRLNQTGYFEPIDKEKDIDFRQNDEEAQVDVNVKVTERGRQEISFNGGVSGIGGSFFGLQYSTANLLGRGESLSFNVAAGNRQKSFVFSFTEPYIRNRPITAGFSIFTSSYKFFGEGSFLSQNLEVQQGLFGSQLDFLNVDETNLFTQNTTGGSVFLSAPLSEFYRRRPFTRFSRIGLSYSISQTSVQDPEVNLQADPNRRIPVLYRQPNILTSRVTPTFVYNALDYRTSNIDPYTGRELAFSAALAGLGGDVRTYQPSLSYRQYFPIRRTGRDQNPEVLGFRILAGTVGSIGLSNKIREAQTQSLAFVNGVPIYERFFLGGEDTIRGYNVRSISPRAPIDTFFTTRNVVLASNPNGTAIPVPGIPSDVANIGVFTGTSGSNVLRLPRFSEQLPTLDPRLLQLYDTSAIGGDTQLLANVEYRIPIFGPVSVAAFADIGTVFNLRKTNDQTISNVYQSDDVFTGLNGRSLSGLVFLANPQLAALNSTAQPTLLLRDSRLVTQEEFNNALRVGPLDANGLPIGFQPVYLRGEGQTNQVLRLSESINSRFNNYRSSFGVEFRVQVPVVNVPFRLIYAYNPNAQEIRDPDSGRRLTFEQKNVFRFSIGRTF